MSYKPLHEMTDRELEREAEIWERARVKSQIRNWVDTADAFAVIARSELRKRQPEPPAGRIETKRRRAHG